MQPAYQIQLAEVDAELTLLGTLFMSPEAFQLAADDIQTEWFSDPFARYLFDACLRIHREGNKLSAPAVVAALPEDCGGVSRGTFYARACASAIHPSGLGGLVSTVKDRWARRALIEASENTKAEAVRFDADPYDLARDTVMALDSISAARGHKRGGSLDQAMQSLMQTTADPNKVRGASTGLYALDNKINGYKPGQLYVIAGRPGMGKSAFMCSSLRRTAQAGKGVLIFSLEMTAEEIAARCASDALDDPRGPFFGNILKGAVSEAEKESLAMAYDSLSGLPLEIEDEPRLTMSEIIGKARQKKAAWAGQGIELGVVCIDHMGLVTPSNRYAGNKVAEAGEVSGLARAMAKELGCCVVLLCQLSREVEKRDDKRPVMSDLRWSGEIEQDAHVIGFLYREAYYLAQDANADPYSVAAAKNRLEFLIRKNRNGETADVKLWCSIGHSSIRDELQ
jgi:replicative DNA helicase